MREILFRGKQTDNGEWVQGYYTGRTDFIDIHEICTTESVGIRYKVIPETIGQYTGLTDKNDVKIFEGDILKRSWADGDVIKSITYYVEYSLGCFWCKGCSSCCESMLGYFTTLAKGNPIEVIGNIHDNPELLGV